MYESLQTTFSFLIQSQNSKAEFKSQHGSFGISTNQLEAWPFKWESQMHTYICFWSALEARSSLLLCRVMSPGRVFPLDFLRFFCSELGIQPFKCCHYNYVFITDCPWTPLSSLGAQLTSLNLCIHGNSKFSVNSFFSFCTSLNSFALPTLFSLHPTTLFSLHLQIYLPHFTSLSPLPSHSCPLSFTNIFCLIYNPFPPNATLYHSFSLLGTSISLIPISPFHLFA